MEDDGTTSGRTIRSQRALNEANVQRYRMLIRLMQAEYTHLSELATRIEALGGKLRVEAVFSDEQIDLLNGRGSDDH